MIPWPQNEPKQFSTKCRNSTAGNPDVKPNTVCFNSVIMAWANSRDPSAGNRAEGILNQMQKLYKAGDPDVKPNTVTLTSAL
jgi:hypothetical protein